MTRMWEPRLIRRRRHYQQQQQLSLSIDRSVQLLHILIRLNPKVRPQLVTMLLPQILPLEQTPRQLTAIVRTRHRRLQPTIAVVRGEPA
jgi:hypothetical protein